VTTALTIAGSDSGGGAGIQADLKTFLAHGVYGASALTAVTAQNTGGVAAVEALPPSLVAAQVDAVLADTGADAVKTGMLATAGIVEAVADALARHQVTRVVVDPVIVATSGARLLDDDALDALRTRLLPHAAVVTPNVPEAEALADLRITSDEEAREAARRILALGPAAVLLKGGHRVTGADVEDLLVDRDGARVFRVPREPGPAAHGTGCTFAAALAAHLARGESLAAAVPAVQRYVAGAIRHGRDGIGARLLDHGWEHPRATIR
jgi:hydroxymethylpyrimidine/phosphomethylpyrimidine kinase